MPANAQIYGAPILIGWRPVVCGWTWVCSVLRVAPPELPDARPLPLLAPARCLGPWRSGTALSHVPTHRILALRKARLDKRHIPAYYGNMRRRAGTLVPTEVEILETAALLQARGTRAFHGFLLAQALQERGDDRDLIGHGTLYRALARLERFGYLTSHWESPTSAIKAHRPMRRLYSLTAEGQAALAAVPREARPRPHLTPRLVPL